jgi:NAD(P)-dependent dehydrogenase (short-subunit alcohol dehydrogenase family)
VSAAPIALVTGAARGIGAAIADELERRGWRVVRNDLEGSAGRGFVAGDISHLDAHARIVEEAFARYGGLHCLVNNAGVQVKTRGDLLDVSAESFDRLIDVNLRGTFFLTQAVARRMLQETGESHPRSIVTISSVNAFIVGANRGEYCMAKSALTMMVKLFAVRLADAGIRCYEVRPGIIRTDMTKPAAERYDRLIAAGIAPIRRWGEPQDVARAVAMLAAGELGYSTGEAIHVDGGMHVQTL